VLLEHVPLFEGAVVEQQLDALARRQLALGVLGVDALLAAAQAARRRFSSSWSMISCMVASPVKTVNVSFLPAQQASSRCRGRRRDAAGLHRRGRGGQRVAHRRMPAKARRADRCPRSCHIQARAWCRRRAANSPLA
jgi:hypothetical protein